MIVAAPRLHAEVAGRFDCAQAVGSSSFGGAAAPAPEAPPAAPPPSEALPPPPADAGATGSCALLDQPLCATGACDEAAPLPPLQSEAPPVAARVFDGPGDEVGALPPTAAAQPPPLDAGGIAGDDSAAVSAASPAAVGPSPVHAPPAIGGFAAAAPQPPLAGAEELAA